jgi:hypothetical protein
MLQTRLSHVALLVNSAARTAAVLEPMVFKIGPAEAWEGEGTLEIYVGDQSTHGGLLLLMEPQKPGAYRRAMEKRGPGLHHVAIDVLDLDLFASQIAGSGWLLHPRSLQTIRDSRTAYLARPGIPMLIEVQQRDALSEKPSLIEEMGLPLPAIGPSMLAALGLQNLIRPTKQESWMTIASHKISFSILLGV